MKKQQQQQRKLKYNMHFQEFNQQLTAFNMFLHDVKADGNCLFRAVADQLDNDQTKYTKYRKVAVGQIKRKKEFYSNFLTSQITMDKYIEDMQTDGTWGGHIELQALSDAIGIDILVYRPDGTTIRLTPNQYQYGCIDRFSLCFQIACLKVGFPTKNPSNKRPRQIHIAFHCAPDITEHYSSIRSINNGDDMFTQI